MSDAINSPDHYAAGRRFETIEVIEDWELGFNLGNVLKYVSRAGRKGSDARLEDLRKAAWYLAREIEKGPAALSSPDYEEILKDYAYETLTNEAGQAWTFGLSGFSLGEA